MHKINECIHVSKHSYNNIYGNTSYNKPKHWTQPISLSTVEWRNKLWYIHFTLVHQKATRMSNILPLIKPTWIPPKRMCVLCLVAEFCRPFATPWAVAHQAPLSTGLLQARILERVAMSSSRGSSPTRNQTGVSCIAGRLFTSWATREACVLYNSI